MILHSNEENFINAIRATAQHLGMREVYIEKDYWVTLVLKRLSLSGFNKTAIFKGGTSLSKALNCIERFSEDIDLAVITDGLTNNQIKKLISNIQKTITQDIPEIKIEGVTSKGSKFRKTAHQYNKVIEGFDFGQATDKLLLEINSFANPTPNSLCSIESYIAIFLTQTNKQELVKRYELEPFEVSVLTINRTLVEKIMGLIRSCYHENPIDQLQKKIRHFYDIERILTIDTSLDFLNSADFFFMIEKVKIDDAANSQFNGDWLQNPLSDSLLFKDLNGVWSQLEETYRSEFKTLVFGELPDSRAIMKSLELVAGRLAAFDQNIK